MFTYYVCIYRFDLFSSCYSIENILKRTSCDRPAKDKNVPRRKLQRKTVQIIAPCICGKLNLVCVNCANKISICGKKPRTRSGFEFWRAPAYPHTADCGMIKFRFGKSQWEKERKNKKIKLSKLYQEMNGKCGDFHGRYFLWLFVTSHSARSNVQFVLIFHLSHRMHRITKTLNKSIRTSH